MRLGKFDILEEIGRGGFGTVYRANDTSLDRIVALKVLHEQYKSDHKFIESFKREARSMAKVSHPNVVQLFEVGDLDGQIFIAMQYFDDGSLEQKIQAGGPMPLKDAIRMINQVARGLEAGHKIGLIHRDVKPANILYSQNGYIAISDFGVVKSIQQGSPDTTNSFNQFAGSPYYIPPELWQSTGKLSPAADVYSLACVFYEALTGEILFEGNTYEHVLTRHMLEAPVFSKSLPESLVDLLSVALAKNPSDRYQTMNDFLRATRAALESKKIKTDKTGSSTQTDVVSELPKPLAPGEITFDQLVRQAQRHTAPQSQAPKPVQQTPPPQPVIKPKPPTHVIPQKDSAASSPAKEVAPAVPEAEKPSKSPSRPKSQTQKSEVNSAKDNFKSETAAIPPISTKAGSEKNEPPSPDRKSLDEESVQASQITGTGTPKKKKVLLPLMISLGLVLLLGGFLIVRFVILPSQTDQEAETQAAQSHTPTTETIAPSYRKQDGMEMVYVPEGSFEMGSITGDEDEKPVRLIYLDTFWIDKYEVTNAQYAQCVAEGDCTKPGSASSYTRESYFGNTAYGNYPVVHVNWYQAQDYCRWTGGNLPTEAQWEKAARGTDSREYPWGNETPDNSRANYDLIIGDTTAVGSYPSGASPFGTLDMAGNVSEWVRDGYDAYGIYNVYNPIVLFNTPYRTIRGGNYFDLPADIRAAYRFYGEPGLSGYDIGFRCILEAETSQLSPTRTTQANRSAVFDSTSEFGIGSTVARELDGMEMVYVPEGSFEMGSFMGDEDEMPAHQVYLDAYWIDKYEVTNQQYAQCVAEGPCSPPTNSSSANLVHYYGNATYANFPVVYMKWNQAQEYCQWVGGDLPTEAQWEKAARGTDGREYPWGNDPPDEFKGNYDYDQGNSLEVGSYPQSVSPYGALDMAGNVWEWVRDWYGTYETAMINNPTGPSSGDIKVMRGGSWYNTTKNVRTSYRGGDDPNNTYYSYGFRCAVTP
jgi:formylglycine-generating enzyme required for sulfatase activity/serine/threonine protein kinase